MLSQKGFTPIVIVLIIFSVFIIGGIIFGLYRFQQSSVYIKQGTDALNAGRINEATEFYNKARDVFPYRPSVGQSLEALNLFVNADTQYGKSYDIPSVINPAATPQPAASPSAAPLSRPPHEVKVPILMYHHIRINPRPKDPVWAALNISPQQLENQLQYFISHGYNTITLDELSDVLLGKIQLPQNPIVLTFDDGYSSFYENAYPLLKKYNMKAINFVITGVVGAGVYLNWSQIKEMDKSSLITFGAHTKHHPALVSLSPKLIQEEIKGSKSDLEKQLKKSIHWFAYPYGSYNNKVAQFVKEAGFSGAVSTSFGVIQAIDSSFFMPRIMVDGRYTLDMLIKKLN